MRDGITPETLLVLIVLLTAEGWKHLVITALLRGSSRTIAASKQRWECGKVAAWDTAWPAHTKPFADRPSVRLAPGTSRNSKLLIGH